MGWEDYFKKAKQEINLADHMAYMTLPMVKDQKVFHNLLKHIDKGLFLAMKAYLKKMNEEKELRIIPHSEELTRRLFLESYSNALSLSVQEIKKLKEINKLVRAHTKSQMDLKRGNEYVIILGNFKTVTVNESKMKEYLGLAKDFIRLMENKI